MTLRKDRGSSMSSVRGSSGSDEMHRSAFHRGYRGPGGDRRDFRRDRYDSIGYSVVSSQSQHPRYRSRSPVSRLDPMITTDVQVADHLIPKMLGKKGCHLRRIEQETGAKISVSKRGVFFPQTSNRIVTIQCAQHMIGRVQDLIREAISVPDRAAVPSVITPLNHVGGEVSRGGGERASGRIGVNGAMIGGRQLVLSALKSGPGKSMPGCYVVAISDSCIGAVLGTEVLLCTKCGMKLAQSLRCSRGNVSPVVIKRGYRYQGTPVRYLYASSRHWSSYRKTVPRGTPSAAANICG